jgi:CRP/FNR family cyclic AMP-dependent transcriptional regulator
MKTVNFKAGDTIISEGDEGRTAFLIVNGSVEVSIGHGSNAKTVGNFNAGDVFGEMSLIEPGKRTATVKASADTECIETSYEEFVAKIEDNPKAALEFMKTLVRRLRHMNEMMASMDPKSAASARSSANGKTHRTKRRAGAIRPNSTATKS